MFARTVAGSLLLAAAFSVASACEDGPIPEPCSNIPAGGCPLSRGVACEDPACEAVYACRPNNVWELQERCPAHQAGSRQDASVQTDAAPAPSFDASIDAPPGAFGGPGCDSLQTPDCALGVVLACGASCCGCEDLYVCEDNGWSLWGTCGDRGIVPEH
jgi:hypothetical protein